MEPDIFDMWEDVYETITGIEETFGVVVDVDTFVKPRIWVVNGCIMLHEDFRR